MQSLSTDVAADVGMASYSHVGNIQLILLPSSPDLDTPGAQIKSHIFRRELDQNVVFEARICHESSNTEDKSRCVEIETPYTVMQSWF